MIYPDFEAGLLLRHQGHGSGGGYERHARPSVGPSQSNQWSSPSLRAESESIIINVQAVS